MTNDSSANYASAGEEQRVNGKAVCWIVDDSELIERIPHWRALELIALDTEFVRERTYYPIPGLIQLYDGSTCYLIDPVSLSSMAPLAALLTDSSVVKVMHSCSEDLELFENVLGVLPEPLFDTQIAAAFVGMGLSIGYQRLVEERLGVHLGKTQTRTDWIRRPLSAEQVLYAAEDVVYLPDVYDGLCEQLTTANRLQWVQKECDGLAARRDPRLRGEQYRQFSGAWRLDPRELALLSALHAWREQLARERDLPRTWLAPDRGLMAIASQMPTTLSALEAIEDIPKGTLRHYERELLSLVDQARTVEDQSLPDPVPVPITGTKSRQVKKLMALVREIAEQFDIAPELLARKRDIEALFRTVLAEENVTASPILVGWRGELMAARLTAAIAEIAS